MTQSADPTTTAAATNVTPDGAPPQPHDPTPPAAPPTTTARTADINSRIAALNALTDAEIAADTASASLAELHDEVEHTRAAHALAVRAYNLKLDAMKEPV